MSVCRRLACLALVAASGCATFGSLTPGSDSSHGVWVAKTTSFMGLQLSDQEVLYCQATDPTKPMCYKAKGKVHASVKVQEQSDE